MSVKKEVLIDGDVIAALYLVNYKVPSLPDACFITRAEQRAKNNQCLVDLINAWQAEDYKLTEYRIEDKAELIEFVNKRYGKKSCIHNLLDADDIIIFDAK